MSTEGLGHHISSRYNEDLERLRSSVLEMGGMVERQLTQAIRGITEPDASMIGQVAQEELRINQLERSIDEDCSRILATRAPTASDLRLIITILKTITDLERIGDHAKNVCEYLIYLVHGKDVRHTRIEEIEKELHASKG